MKKIKKLLENKKLCFVLIVVLIIFIFSIYVALRAEIIHLQIREELNLLDQTTRESELSKMQLETIFYLAYQRIALFAGIMFAGTFLILKSIEKDK